MKTILKKLLFLWVYNTVVLAVFLATILARMLFIRYWVRRLHRRSQKHSVVFLAAFFPGNAGYHWRAQCWSEHLKKEGFQTRVLHVLSGPGFQDKINNHLFTFYLTYVFKRILHAFRSLGYNSVIVRRELLLYNDYGNLFLERFLLALHPNVILDFDDDISDAKFEPRTISTYGKLLLEHPEKFKKSVNLYNRFTPGSNYLSGLIKQWRQTTCPFDAHVLPTCVDYLKHDRKEYDASKTSVNFGWIGGVGNLFYLDMIVPALEQLAQSSEIQLTVISGQVYENEAAKSLKIINKQWQLDKEIEYLKDIDVGLMPLLDRPMERGKCGFKLIQYMGLGVVSIGSAITVNNDIIDHGVNGFLVYKEEDWPNALKEVIEQRGRFNEISQAAREKIAQEYSFDGTVQSFNDFLRKPQN